LANVKQKRWPQAINPRPGWQTQWSKPYSERVTWISPGVMVRWRNQAASAGRSGAKNPLLVGRCGERGILPACLAGGVLIPAKPKKANRILSG